MHSIAAGILLPKDQIHFWDEIAYYHVPFTHCPTSEQTRLDLKCHCNPSDNFDWKGYSCMFIAQLSMELSYRALTEYFFLGTSRYFQINNMRKPADYELQQ